MSKDETSRELEKLRADVAALSDARRETAVQPVPPQPAEAESPAAEPIVASDPELPEEQKTQLEELGDLLQAEIRDLPTVTCLTVFSLGILMGRMMR